MPDFPSTTTTAATSTGSTDDTTQPTMETTTSLTELGSGKFYAPCASESACNTRRQELDIPRFEVGEFPMKGCFSKNDIAYWSIGGTKEEELREELPGSQERIWCTMADDASLFPTPSSTTIPTTTTTSTTTTATSSSSSSTATELPTIVVTRVGGTSNVPTMITTTTTEEGTSDVPTMITTTTTTEESSSNVPTTITTEVGSGTFVVPKTCATELECDTRRQQLDILRFEVGEFPTKGCFTKNGIAFWSTGGTVEEEMREDLPGIQERIWCDDVEDAEEDDSFTTSAIGDPCEIGPSANATKSCGTGEFCELDVGVCNTKVAVFEGTCTAIPQACTLNYVPVRRE